MKFYINKSQLGQCHKLAYVLDANRSILKGSRANMYFISWSMSSKISIRKENMLLKGPHNLQFIENHLEKQENYPHSTIVIAALNEEQGIGLTIAELKETLRTSHILVVDGHSSDRTVDVARKLGADVVFQDGLGKGDAISKALKQTNANLDYIVFTDADFTYPAKYVRDMFKILEKEPEVSMVCGNRFNVTDRL